MKITIYELLGMIKDGIAPHKVKYQNEIYIMDDLEYFYVNDENKTPLFESIFDKYSDYVALNEEVEILDNLEIEKKIPEKLEQIMSKRGKYNSIDELAEEVFKAFETINDLIINQNEIIDTLEMLNDKIK